MLLRAPTLSLNSLPTRATPASTRACQPFFLFALLPARLLLPLLLLLLLLLQQFLRAL